MVGHFLHQRVNFFDLLEKSSTNLLQAAKTLVDLMEDYPSLQLKVAEIMELEHRGDTLTHQIMEQLHLIFVTPIDREDIVLLTQRLDDVLDAIEAGVQLLILYKIERPTERAREQARLILRVVEAVTLAMQQLRQHRKLRQLLTHCVEINTLENEADQTYRQALAELFQDSMPIIDIIKWREIYELFESAVDRAEDVADVLEGVVLKYA
ncbi:MAG: DUF47 domain-containing protein [Chloroflexi bacterium]|nr:DUF47 domain-containing protein [Chloroflexota bacterium]